jgi:hypothetical protein
MSDLELIQLYQELTASGEALARSVSMFVQSRPFLEREEPVPPSATPAEPTPPPLSEVEPPPGAED